MKLTINLNDREEMLDGISLLESRVHRQTQGVIGTVVEESDITAPKDKVSEFIEEATGEAVPETDAEGFPWDARIHSSSKKQTQKGVWRLMRFVDKDLVAKVRAELAGPADIAEPETTTPPAPESAAPPPPVDEMDGADVYIQNGIEFSVTHLRKAGWSDDQIRTLEKKGSDAPPPPPAPGTPDVTTFPQLMQRITAAINEGELTNQDVDVAVKAEGVAELQLLAARPDLVPAVEARLF